MNVKQAKDVGREWVLEEVSKNPHFDGAFFAGSTNWMSDEAPFPGTSDLDIKIVLADSDPPDNFEKHLYQGVMIDTSYISNEQLQTPDMILGNYFLAGHFTTPDMIIADPSGQLTKIQATVSRNFAQREWVVRRCEHARNQVLNSLEWLQESQPWHDQVFAWIYPTSTTTHVLLVAGLQNPTVHRMFAATRDLLAAYDQLLFQETLLALLGSVDLDRARVERHLEATMKMFDAAKEVIKTPFFGSTDLSDGGRSIAVDSNQRLIERAYHREAMFGITLTQTWCQKALYNDAPRATQERFKLAYQELLDDLGIPSPAVLQQRHDQVRDYLPRVWEVTETIIALNPGIKE